MNREKSGFVYIWRDRKHNRYYVGCHWGFEDDGYVCSSNWMRDAYKRRPEDFKRRILTRNIPDRISLYEEEMRYFNMIKPEELRIRYYNLRINQNEIWHKYDEHIKTVGQKISATNKGRLLSPPTPEKAAAISKAKKGKLLTEEHKQALRGLKKTPRTDEWKAENSKRMKEIWSDGSRKRKEPKNSMSKDEQGKLSSVGLKARWADPVWAANQRAKLKEARNKRGPASEESKMKARLSRLGKPKIRKNINTSNEELRTN